MQYIVNCAVKLSVYNDSVYIGESNGPVGSATTALCRGQWLRGLQCAAKCSVQCVQCAVISIQCTCWSAQSSVGCVHYTVSSTVTRTVYSKVCSAGRQVGGTCGGPAVRRGSPTWPEGQHCTGPAQPWTLGNIGWNCPVQWSF